MSKPWKPGRQAVELRPSRIRRDPVRLVESKVEPPSREREVWGTVAGVVLFALAGAALVVGFSDITNHRTAAATKPAAQFGHCYNHSGPNCVVDGETILIGGEKVEIAGIDVPEIGEPACPEEASRGVEAAVRLLELLNSGKVTMTGTERGADGYLRRKVEVDGKDVANAMVSSGVARVSGGGSRSWCG